MTDTTEPEDLGAAIAAAVAASDYAEAARLQAVMARATAAGPIDIDAMFADEPDLTPDPIIVRVLGRDWSFPGELPTAALARLAEWESRQDDDPRRSAAMDVLLLVGDLIPDRILEAWSRESLSITRNGEPDPRFMAVVWGLVEAYSSRMISSAAKS